MPVAYVSLLGVSESLHSNLHSSLDVASEVFRSSINCFLAFCGTIWPFILPPLFAIALEAPLSQRTWIAVQKTPISPRTDALPPNTYLQKLRKHALTHLAPVYFLLVSLLAAYFQCVARVSPERMRVFEGVVFGPLFGFATSRLFGLLSRMYTSSVRRDADGEPHIIRTLRPSVPRLLGILPVLLGLLVTYRAICYGDNICKAVVHAALLHVFIATDVRSTKSVRAVGIYAATNIATLLALTIFLAIHAKEIKVLLSSASDSPYPAWEEFSYTRLAPNNEMNNDYDSEDSRMYGWPLFALSVLWNIFPVELITLCYRFDFARSARKRGSGLVLESLEGSASILDNTWTGSKPSLTHDMLLDSATFQGKNASVGPISLAPDAPDAFYGHQLPLSSPSTCTDSSLPCGNRDISKTTAEGTPLPSTLSGSTSIPFPAFLTSLVAYVLSTLILLALFYLTVKGQNEVVMKYLAPLLPLVTLPLATIAVPACFALTEDSEGGIIELWRYVEVWGSEAEKNDENRNLEARDVDAKSMNDEAGNKGEMRSLWVV